MVYPAKTGSPRTVTFHEFEGVTRVTLDDPDGLLTGLLEQDLAEPIGKTRIV
jgi:hypothetical protein